MMAFIIILGAIIRLILYYQVNFPESAEGRLFFERLYTQEDLLFGGGNFFRAMSIYNGNYFLSSDDFVNPPGTTILIATLLKLGLSATTIQFIWIFASIVTMIVSFMVLRHWLEPIWQTLGMILVAIDFSAASYGAYVTSEVPAMLLVALGFYFISKSMRMTLQNQSPDISSARSYHAAGVGGVFIGISALFWSMGVGLVIGVCIAGLLAKIRMGSLFSTFFLIPEWREVWWRAASRCFFTVSTLSVAVFLLTGRVGVANLGYPARLLMAQMTEPRVITFENKAQSTSQSFGLTYHYQRRAIHNYRFPFPASDQLSSFKEAVKIFRAQPVESVNRSVVNAYNMFSGNIGWPNFTSPLRRVVEFGEIGFLYFVIVPLCALIFTIPLVQGSRENPLLLILLTIGAFFCFGLFQPGDTRLRVPIDGVLVLVTLLLLQDYVFVRRSLRRNQMS